MWFFMVISDLLVNSNFQDDETTLLEEEELAKEESNDPIDEVKG